MFVISDFFDKNYLDTLKIVAQKHDVIACRILDPRELNIPKLGYIYIEDTESGKEILVNTKNRDFQNNFKKNIDEKINNTTKELKRLKIDLIDIRTDQSYIKNLIKFFKQREKKIR